MLIVVFPGYDISGDSKPSTDSVGIETPNLRNRKKAAYTDVFTQPFFVPTLLHCWVLPLFIVIQCSLRHWPNTSACLANSSPGIWFCVSTHRHHSAARGTGSRRPARALTSARTWCGHWRRRRRGAVTVIARHRPPVLPPSSPGFLPDTPGGEAEGHGTLLCPSRNPALLIDS